MTNPDQLHWEQAIADENYQAADEIATANEDQQNGVIDRSNETVTNERQNSVMIEVGRVAFRGTNKRLIKTRPTNLVSVLSWRSAAPPIPKKHLKY